MTISAYTTFQAILWLTGIGCFLMGLSLGFEMGRRRRLK